MPDPDGREDHPADRHVFHHDKPERHQDCDHDDDTDFRLNGHAFFIQEGLEMFLVQRSSPEPAVQPVRRFREEKDGPDEKREGRQERQHDADTAGA